MRRMLFLQIMISTQKQLSSSFQKVYSVGMEHVLQFDLFGREVLHIYNNCILQQVLTLFIIIHSLYHLFVYFRLAFE